MEEPVTPPPTLSGCVSPSPRGLLAVELLERLQGEPVLLAQVLQGEASVDPQDFLGRRSSVLHAQLFVPGNPLPHALPARVLLPRNPLSRCELLPCNPLSGEVRALESRLLCRQRRALFAQLGLHGVLDSTLGYITQKAQSGLQKLTRPVRLLLLRPALWDGDRNSRSCGSAPEFIFGVSVHHDLAPVDLRPRLYPLCVFPGVSECAHIPGRTLKSLSGCHMHAGCDPC